MVKSVTLRILVILKVVLTTSIYKIFLWLNILIKSLIIEPVDVFLDVCVSHRMDQKPGNKLRKNTMTCKYSLTNASDKFYKSNGQRRSAAKNYG